MFRTYLLVVLLNASAAVLAQTPAAPDAPATGKTKDAAASGSAAGEKGAKNEKSQSGAEKTDATRKSHDASMNAIGNTKAREKAPPDKTDAANEKSHDMSKSSIGNIKAREKAPPDKGTTEGAAPGAKQ